MQAGKEWRRGESPPARLSFDSGHAPSGSQSESPLSDRTTLLYVYVYTVRSAVSQLFSHFVGETDRAVARGASGTLGPQPHFSWLSPSRLLALTRRRALPTSSRFWALHVAALSPPSFYHTHALSRRSNALNISTRREICCEYCMGTFYAESVARVPY